jgi:hypothetical protein
MARTSKSRGASGFKMKSGNKTVFKAMGATDPADQFIEDKDVKTKQGDEFTVSNYFKTDKEYKELKKSKGRDKLVNLEERYNTTFKKDEDGVFRNPEGKSPSELEETRLVLKNDPEA